MKEYQRIQMLNNNYCQDGIFKGAIGYILNVYDDNYCEVEFSDGEGITYALQSIDIKDFIVIDKN